ncbi:MAG: cupin domain-containing protein, partial [bacterium]|nr:cupin domain-containing protein [bacterium]
TAKLGLNAAESEQPQYVIKAGSWFAAALINRKSKIENHQPQAGPPVAEKSYALIGCTVAPGFDFTDFEIGNRLKLRRKFPKQRALINKLTKAC